MIENEEDSSTTGVAVEINGHSRCDFCGLKDNNVVKYGPKYRLGKIKTHYYCVLLSGCLRQNGQDNEGMLGFLLKDIKTELKRCSEIKCIYCGKGYANILCKTPSCKKNFHLPCGLKIGTLHQFTGCYNSYCHIHRKYQIIPKAVLKEAQENKVVCCICYDQVPLWNRMNYIWAMCCQKTWYHKKCLQKLALSAGYFFRCATCNNSTKFIKCVLKLGIFIPQQDASWELVPNAFSELLFKYEQCDADICKCPKGRRSSTEDSIWEITLCKSCGSQGIHIGCRNSNFNGYNWECHSCQKVSESLKSKKRQESIGEASAARNQIKTRMEIFRKKRSRPTEEFENFVLDKRKKCRSEAEDDVEIDVVTVEKVETENKTDVIEQSYEVNQVRNSNVTQNLEEVLASVKPGPLSFKLRMIENYSQLLESSEKSKEETEDFSTETNSGTSSCKGAQFYSPLDIGIWNDKANNFVVIMDHDEPDAAITSDRDVIMIYDN